MHYIINGGGIEINLMRSEKMLSYYKDFGIKNLLIIPFAIKELNILQKIYFAAALNMPKELDIKVDHLKHDDARDIMLEKINQCDAIYFPGGMQSVLLQRLKKRGLDKKIRELISNKQIKLISGGSAGEMVLGEKVIIGHVEVKKVKKGLDYIHGFIIDSHFSNRNRLERLQEVLKKYDYKYTGIGVDENTAVVLDESFAILDVFGEGNAYIVSKEEVKKYG